MGCSELFWCFESASFFTCLIFILLYLLLLSWIILNFFLRRKFSCCYEENIYLLHYLTGIITRSHRMGANRMEILCQCDRSHSMWRPCQPGGHADRLCREALPDFVEEWPCIYASLQQWHSCRSWGGLVEGVSAVCATYLVFLYVSWFLKGYKHLLLVYYELYLKVLIVIIIVKILGQNFLVLQLRNSL